MVINVVEIKTIFLFYKSYIFCLEFKKESSFNINPRPRQKKCY